MPKLERSIVINAPVEKVFGYIDDPTHTPEWIPGMIEVMDVTGQGAGKRFRWAYKLAGLRFQGESTWTEYIPNKRIVDQSRGGIVSTWTYAFAPEGGGTRLSLMVEYTVPMPVLGKLAEALVRRQNEREADLAMANLKAILEART